MFISKLDQIYIVYVQLEKDQEFTVYKQNQFIL